MHQPTDNSASIEIKGFNRTLAEIEWLLLVLILVYMALPSRVVEHPLRILFAGAIFAGFVVGFRYINLFTLPARWKFTIETWAMLGLTAVAVWNTGKVDSPLLNLFLLVVIFSALTLGCLVTLLEVVLITSFYLLAAFSEAGADIFSYESFSHLMLEFSPFMLVAYVTSLLAADLGSARSFAEQLAETDELTGLYNMRAFKQALSRHERQARRTEGEFSILMLDVDNLKHINDQYGHDIGNRVIRKVADIIGTSLRADDTVARYGGDEFIALLAHAPEKAACLASERILRRIAKTRIDSPDGPVGISISIGLATYPAMAEEVDLLVRNADAALYASKRGGRNRMSVFSDL